ncbi:MAG: hypothetical protein ISS77_00440 [Phycisphaerae bacterium]|nr:hypothetical protein [Phycisphaerae bacterium]
MSNKKLSKYTFLALFSIVILCFSFMIGRNSWLIQKPNFLLDSKEKFYIQKAKESLIQEGITQKRLSDPWVRNAVIVDFKDNSGFSGPRVILDKISGECLQGSW